MSSFFFVYYELIHNIIQYLYWLVNSFLMYKKLKYITLILFLIGATIFFYDYYKTYNYYSNSVLGLSNFNITLSALLFSLILIFFLLPRKKKLINNKLTFIFSGIVLIFFIHNIAITNSYYQDYKYRKVMNEYFALDCLSLEKKFKTDLGSNNLKFFSTGIVYDKNFGRKLKSYNIYEFFQGDIINNNLECYNNLVIEYLKKEKQINLYMDYIPKNYPNDIAKEEKIDFIIKTNNEFSRRKEQILNKINLLKKYDISKEELAKIESNLTYKNILQALREPYLNNFTAKEIDELYEFYTSDIFKKSLSISGKLISDSENEFNLLTKDLDEKLNKLNTEKSELELQKSLTRLQKTLDSLNLKNQRK